MSTTVTDTIMLRSDKSWTASVVEETASWCTVSAIDGIGVGESGYGTLIVTAQNNETFTERVCSIVIESYDYKYTITVTQAPETEVVIEDAQFKAHLILDKTINTNKDDKISLAEAKLVTSLDVREGGIKSLSGIEHFTNLDKLNASDNPLATLDVSANTKLTELRCTGSYVEDVAKLTTLDVSANTELVTLDVDNNNLTVLDVSALGQLESNNGLDCDPMDNSVGGNLLLTLKVNSWQLSSYEGWGWGVPSDTDVVDVDEPVAPVAL